MILTLTLTLIQSLDLCYIALEFCSHSLKPGGSFLCKFLRGSDDDLLLKEASRLFSDVKIVKPKASRNESTEIFLLARKKLQIPNSNPDSNLNPNSNSNL
jgi:23S rRNA U2552 (ribose-2'-O)-methylase RlmE/FtsJ